MGTNTKKKLYMILVAAALAILLGVGAYFAFSAEQEPEEVLIEYMAAIEQGEYEQMYEMLDVHSKKKVSCAAFIARNRKIYEGIQAKNIVVEPEQWDSHSDSLSYLTTMETAAGKIAFPNRMIFYKEERAWKIRWNSQMIHPSLPENGKVHVTTLPAVRGDILDRNGKLLAGEGTVYSVGLVPGEMKASTDLGKLAALLDITEASIEKKLNASWVTDGVFVPIRELKEIDEIAAELQSLPGVTVHTVPSRVYPLEEAAAHLTGYVQDISAEELEEKKKQGYSSRSVVGKSGLEALYEKQLHGRDGCKIYITNEKGVEIKVVAQKNPQNGEEIKTTIDGDLQRTLYQTLQKENSASVAMDPKTGEVLALVSTPSFASGDFTLGMTERQWKELNDDPDSPMYNRFRAVWCPGSSLKPIVAAMAMTAGRLDPEKDFGSSGRSWQKDGSWGAYRVTTLHAYNGPANLENAMIHSDNIYFAKLALELGKKTYSTSMEKLGFGEKIPFPIAMDPSQYANDGEIVDEIQLADSGYGQGQVLVNPLHLASLYTAFVNGGDVYKPQLVVSHGEKADGSGAKKEKKTDPYWIRSAFSQEAVAEIRNDMKKVIEDPAGTGHGAKLEGAVLMGKTGTAELKASKEDTGGQELGWFAVIHETEENPLLLVTMVEDVRNRGGSTYVVKKMRTVLEQLI